MKAKEFLMQIGKLDKIIENKEYEKQRWKDIATSVTNQIGSEKVQSSGGKDKIANAVAKYIDIEHEIDADIDKMIDIKRDVMEIIETLDVEEYDILHKRYIQGLDFYEIALLLDKSYSWVTSKHGTALKHLQQKIDERECNETQV